MTFLPFFVVGSLRLVSEISTMAYVQRSFLALNDDVLSAVVFHLDPASARQLSYTAHLIHTIAQHRALESAEFHSIENAVKFFAYMLHKVPHRLRALRELDLRCEVFTTFTGNYPQRPHPKEFYADAASLLTRLLREAVNLRALVMVSAEAWMDHEPDMVDVLSQLRTLKEIEFGSTGPHTSDFLHKMQSAPVKLLLCAPRFDPNFAPWRLALEAHPPYPSVEVLSMIDPLSHHFPGPDQLARIFPNVTALSVSRKQPRQIPTSPIVTWPALERIRGTVGSLQGWTTGAPVHLMELVGYMVCSKVGRLRAVRNTIFATFSPPCTAADSLVANFQPVALILNLETAKAPEHVERSLVRSSSRLRYLAITLDLVHALDAESWWVSRLYRLNIDLGDLTDGIYQPEFCFYLAETNIVCFELRFVVAPQAQTLASVSTKLQEHEQDAYEQPLLHTLGDPARNTPSSHRYVSIEVVSDANMPFPWGHDFLAPEYGHAQRASPKLRWWSVEQTGHRAARSLEAYKGRRIADYLRSAKYDCSKPFDG